MFSLIDKYINEFTADKLFSEIPEIDSDIIKIDSRNINNRDVFCAYPGHNCDGREFINDAVAKNAGIILYEENWEKPKIQSYSFKNLAHHIGLILHRNILYTNIIAVTGTNGKTTVCFWLKQAYQMFYQKAGIIGTIGNGTDLITPSTHTTPNPIELKNLLTKFNADMVVIEASSHALEQGRLNGINIKTAVFTNLTHEHLDYHKTIDEYFLAKKKLFYWKSLENIAINADDNYGKILINELCDNVLSYGIHAGNLRATNITHADNKLTFQLRYENLSQEISTNIIGYFNIYNLLALFATLLLNKFNWIDLPKIASKLSSVPGRMEIIHQKPLIIIDYAHTPDALESALLATNSLTDGKIFCVFGCGGNRDKEKRSIMGIIALKYSIPIITSDNPRNENENDIATDIIANRSGFIKISDRQDAIKYAINNAKPNDAILIAGKGHESHQEIAGNMCFFNDKTAVENILYNKDL